MRKRKIIAYRSVYDRKNPLFFSLEDLINNPNVIYNGFKIDNIEDRLKEIKSESDKEFRNILKRNYMPAVDLSESGVLSIDIDGVSDNKRLRRKIITKLKKIKHCMCVCESASGNLFALFKYECSKEHYKFLYYKLYMQLTTLLDVNIDYLPELNRLRYVSNGEVFYLNTGSKVVVDKFEGSKIPYINTNISEKGIMNVCKKNNRVIYKSE